MVLAMFVDAGHTGLLAALAGGSVRVPPTVIHPNEVPPFDRQPAAEFAMGLYNAQRDLLSPLHAMRVQRRTAFYQAVGTAWRPVFLSPAEIQQTRYFVSSAARQAVRRIDPTLRVKRIQAGEAEAAAVAVTRGWTLWTDDLAMVNILSILHPDCKVERIGALLMRAVHEGLLGCQEAADLYNDVFKRTLRLWTTITLVCNGGRLTSR